MKKCIVTFADNKVRYQLGIDQMTESLKKIKFDGDFLCFRDYSEIQSPTHEEIPYAFKAYSIKKAFELGYDLVLWMDAPVYATKSLTKVFKHIETKGYLFFDNIGFSIGDYTSDRCLELMGMTREEAFESKMIMACVMGLHKSKVKKFTDCYIKLADSQHYGGAWKNDNGQVSLDKRVKGHRHDQSVASILVKQMNLKITHPHSTFFAYQGHDGHLPHAKTVCLLSHGF